MKLTLSQHLHEVGLLSAHSYVLLKHHMSQSRVEIEYNSVAYFERINDFDVL